MISLTSEYALRALVALAQDSSGSMVLARDLAERADVPPKYLSKVLAVLSRGGIVFGTRGVNGGYRLATDPSEIPLIAIIELFEGKRARPACLLGGGRKCDGTEPCPAHEAWKKVKESYLDFLENCTLASISRAPKPKKRRR